MKIAIIYHSESGNTKMVTGLLAEGAKISGEIEVRAISLEEIDEMFVAEALAVIFGCPTYCGSLSWQMKRWFDTTKIKLEGKLGSAFATENHIGGGADLAELAMLSSMLVRGMLAYTAGAGRGAPYTHYGAVTIREGYEVQQQRARILGQRIAEKALELFGRVDR